MTPTSLPIGSSSGAGSRRRFLVTALGACVACPPAFAAQTDPQSQSLTKEQRDQLMPAQVLEAMRQGNQRFQSGQSRLRNYRDQQRAARPGSIRRPRSSGASIHALPPS